MRKSFDSAENLPSLSRSQDEIVRSPSPGVPAIVVSPPSGLLKLRKSSKSGQEEEARSPPFGLRLRKNSKSGNHEEEAKSPSTSPPGSDPSSKLRDLLAGENQFYQRALQLCRAKDLMNGSKLERLLLFWRSVEKMEGVIKSICLIKNQSVAYLEERAIGQAQAIYDRFLAPTAVQALSLDEIECSSRNWALRELKNVSADRVTKNEEFSPLPWLNLFAALKQQSETKLLDEVPELARRENSSLETVLLDQMLNSNSHPALLSLILISMEDAGAVASLTDVLLAHNKLVQFSLYALEHEVSKIDRSVVFRDKGPFIALLCEVITRSPSQKWVKSVLGDAMSVAKKGDVAAVVAEVIKAVSSLAEKCPLLLRRLYGEIAHISSLRMAECIFFLRFVGPFMATQSDAKIRPTMMGALRQLLSRVTIDEAGNEPDVELDEIFKRLTYRDFPTMADTLIATVRPSEEESKGFWSVRPKLGSLKTSSEPTTVASLTNGEEEYTKKGMKVVMKASTIVVNLLISNHAIVDLEGTSAQLQWLTQTLNAARSAEIAP